MKPIQKWLSEYEQSHKNETNKLIHWICVPAIFWSILALLYCIKLPLNILDNQLNVAHFALLIILIYYFRLSKSLSIGMLFFAVVCLAVCFFIETYIPFALWKFALLVFLAAWIGQFYGHKIEGAKPSFLNDIQFLLIGPAWLMSFIYKNLGIKM
jgi:uncharacterized membrane protein YGL010W